MRIIFLAICTVAATLLGESVAREPLHGNGYSGITRELCPRAEHGYPIENWDDLISCVGATQVGANELADVESEYDRIAVFLDKNRDVVPRSAYLYWKGLISESKGDHLAYENFMRQAEMHGNGSASYEMFRITGDRIYLEKAVKLNNINAVEIVASELYLGAERKADPIMATRILERSAFAGAIQSIESLDTELEFIDPNTVDFWRVAFTLLETGERPQLTPMGEDEWKKICRVAREHPRVLSHMTPVVEMTNETRGAALEYLYHCGTMGAEDWDTHLMGANSLPGL